MDGRIDEQVTARSHQHEPHGKEPDVIEHR